MDTYRGLAKVYDRLLQGMNYQEWADYVEQLIQYAGIKPCRQIIDLACGTGNSTFPWKMKGYQVCGVDISPEMVTFARQKAKELGYAVNFFEQDIRDLHLPFFADAAVLYQDGLNYLLNTEDLKKAFLSIRSILRPGGCFIFNLNMVDKLPAKDSAEVSWLEEDDFTLIWESSLAPGTKIWNIKLTAFISRSNGFYEKIQEEHSERSYSREEIELLLHDSGWDLKSCFQAFTFREPEPQDRNLFFIIQRGD